MAPSLQFHFLLLFVSSCFVVGIPHTEDKGFFSEAWDQVLSNSKQHYYPTYVTRSSLVEVGTESKIASKASPGTLEVLQTQTVGPGGIPILTLILIVACFVGVAGLLYLFRDKVRPCVEFIEKACEYFVRCVVWPFRMLSLGLKICCYPIKEGFIGCYDKCHHYYYPASQTH